MTKHGENIKELLNGTTYSPAELAKAPLIVNALRNSLQELPGWLAECDNVADEQEMQKVHNGLSAARIKTLIGQQNALAATIQALT